MPALPILASRTNTRAKQLRAAFAGHARLSGGLVALEGENLVYEAIRSGVTLETVFLAQNRAAPAWLPHSVELLHLTDEVFASVADTRSPQGIAALFAPRICELDDAFPSSAAPLLLIAAELQDPGNLGTLVRTAEAFSATAILTTPGTVSPWNQKAIRASAGSIFRMPVIPVTHAEVLALKSREIHLFAAVADDTTQSIVPIAEADLTQPSALLIGNEGAGLSADLLALADTRITIPTPGRVESLNAAIAGSLLLYEAARQRASRPTAVHTRPAAAP